MILVTRVSCSDKRVKSDTFVHVFFRMLIRSCTVCLSTRVHPWPLAYTQVEAKLSVLSEELRHQSDHSTSSPLSKPKLRKAVVRSHASPSSAVSPFTPSTTADARSSGLTPALLSSPTGHEHLFDAHMCFFFFSNLRIFEKSVVPAVYLDIYLCFTCLMSHHRVLSTLHSALPCCVYHIRSCVHVFSAAWIGSPSGLTQSICSEPLCLLHRLVCAGGH